MRKFLTLTLLCYCISSIHITGQVQSESNPVALAKSGGVTQNNIWSVFTNPAGLSDLKNLTSATCYHLPYNIQELSTKSIIVATPFKYGALSAKLSYYGFNIYHETLLSLSYSKHLTPKINGSIQANWLSTTISQSGNGNQLYMNVGILIRPNDQITIGAFVSNPENSTVNISEQNINIPSSVNIGFQWDVNQNYNTTIEYEKTINTSQHLKFGMEYILNNQIWIRAGIKSKPVSFSFGAGIKHHNITFDIGFANHTELGLSSNIGISYSFKTKVTNR